ncbi:MAG: hypothetical protein OFPII_42060 [Osedax symbiont Rs1]|nr:MAG: hypothetical protein OFPII_42060 [Osedax symbiont Rs1]
MAAILAQLQERDNQCKAGLSLRAIIKSVQLAAPRLIN